MDDDTVNLKELSKDVVANNNIGYLIELNNRIGQETLLRIANEVIWGTFSIPEAIGFSTPLKSLGTLDNAYLIFRWNKGNKPNLDQWKRWRNIYSTETTRKITANVATHSSDCIECVICLEPYKLGDKILIYDCKHRVHVDCASLSSVRAACPCCRAQGVKKSLDSLDNKQKISQILKENGF